MVSRRAFCAFTGAALVTPRVWASNSGDLRDWLACLRDREAAARVGARLRSGFGETPRGLWADSLARLTSLAGEASRDLLRRIIADEFRNGQTVILEGVLFSRTEVVLFDQAYRAAFST